MGGAIGYQKQWQTMCQCYEWKEKKIVVNYLITFGTNSTQVVRDSHEVRVAMSF